ncbi:Holliday junction branch migration protein RuvA [Dongia soli]|uniref:Holliday junction branch migration complex subunit RuvA n=1 Tax=Dongia soli TaxID=600628 RepID=A0ABU5ECV0_9PROT|nr:Holliday junction branch migration protein RuvA [Dongia soli]MDY0883385.1 Holliday junction branch migration protein RuvA [Dongia soli]
MIGKLTGKIDSIQGDAVIVDVGGVGYVVHAANRTLQRLGASGTAVSLLIETQVREDAINLFGFVDQAERDWFRLLLTVQGVGAKVGLAILGVLGPDDLTTAIAAQDKTAITRAPGVGPKLAARIVAELKDKVGSLSLGTAALKAAAAGGEGKAAGGKSNALIEDAVSALVNLGYRRAEAFTAVAKAQHATDGTASLDHLIRAGLKELSQ